MALSTKPLHATGLAAIASLLDAADAPGVAIALIVNGEPVVAQGVGFRDVDRTQPLNGHDQFYLESITKTFIAVAAMRLIEDGPIDLDDTIQTLLPEIALDRPVTLRQLLNHTGGVPDYSTLPNYFEDVRADPGAPWTTDAFLAHVDARVSVRTRFGLGLLEHWIPAGAPCHRAG